MTLLFMGINLHANTLTTQEDTIVDMTNSLFEDNFNSNDALTKIKIMALPSKGLLKLGTNTISLNQECRLRTKATHRNSSSRMDLNLYLPCLYQ